MFKHSQHNRELISKRLFCQNGRQIAEGGGAGLRDRLHGALSTQG